MKGRRILTILFIAIVFVFLGLVFSNKGRQDKIKDHQEQIKGKVQSYNQKTNEDGIAVDMSDNPYFMTKQPGYSYPKPDTITYQSKVTGTNRHAMVLLPKDYDESKEYPVLYLLHGLDGSHRTWKNKDAHIIIRNLSYFYNVPEMIVVFPIVLLTKKRIQKN